MSKHKDFSLKKIFPILFILFLIAAAVWMFFFSDGFGFGNGSGNGDAAGNTRFPDTSSIAEESDSSVVTETTTRSTQSMQYVKLTVSVNDYLFQDSKYSAEELPKLLSAVQEILKSEDLSIQIIDDHASKNAYDALTAQFQQNDIPYFEEEPS